jgi:hypothetical protein
MYNTVFLFCMKTKKEERKKGLAKTFMQDLKAGLKTIEVQMVKATVIIAGLNKRRAQRAIFEKLGFTLKVPEVCSRV